ncbi:MAG: C1 family peptidase [Terriglobales bacterium]
MAPVLDRRPYFDNRSRLYPVRTLLPDRITRTKTIWGVPPDVLDQGNEGACVGFGWSGELAAAPVTAKELPGAPTISNPYAMDVYHKAQVEDRAMGNNWPEGASVLAGAKAVTKMGVISEYRWAFGINDAIDTLCSHGPVVLGIPWYDGMFSPDNRGLLSVTGPVAGGHCIMAYGFIPNDPTFGSDMIWLRNSWGAVWGINGTAYIRTSDLSRLLSEQGECCVPTDKAAAPAPAPTQADAADVALATVVKPWAATRHYGQTRTVADACNTWLTAKRL